MQKLSIHRLALLGILILCAALLMINLTQPWVGLDGTAGVKRSIEAKNYLRYGFIDLKFGQANTYHSVSSLNELTYYMHHPPLTSILIALSFLLLGVSEAAYRLLFILLTLGSVWIFHSIARRCYGDRIAIIATLIFAVLPATTFFGRSNYEPTTLFFILLAVWTYLRWLEERNAARFGVLMAAYAASLLTDWPAYFLGGLLPAHFLLSEKRDALRHKEIALIPLLTVGMFGLFLYYTYLVDPKAVESLFLQGKIYIGAVKEQGQVEMIRQTAAHGGEYITFTAGQFVNVLLNRFLMLHLYPVLVLAAFGFWRLVNNLRGKGNYRHDLLLLALLLLPTAYCVIFYRSAYIHWVWIFYFSVPLAMLAALGVEAIVARAGEKTGEPGWRIPLPYLFFIALILLPAVTNLKELHNMQRKVLPGDQHERVTLVTGIARQLKALTGNDDLVLTNLRLDHAGLKGGPMLHYYAERRIAGDVDAVAELEKHLAQPGSRPVHFLLWVDKQQHGEDNPGLGTFLEQHYPYESFTVEGHAFRHFRLR